MEEQTYTVGQLANVAGTTVRTIQYYDKIGLLTARRSGDKQARTYSQSDLVKLQQILFYKKLGMPLTEIRQSCVSYDDREDLKRILARQNELLFRKEAEIKTNRAIIAAILSAMEAGQSYNLEAIVKLTLNLKQDAILDYLDVPFDSGMAAVFTQHGMDGEKAAEIYWQWKRLLLMAVSLKHSEVPPDSDAGYQFGKKWHVFVRGATNDSRELADAYTSAERQSALWPAEDKWLMDYCGDFIEQAYRCFRLREGNENEEFKRDK